MTAPLHEYRAQYLDTLLDFLWREWTALGVAGRDRTPRQHVIDPEALLLLTCTFGRYDPRLFDEVMDWLLKNGRFINVQRLRTMLRKEDFQGGPVLVAVAHWLSRHGNPAKWKSLTQSSVRTGANRKQHPALAGGPVPSGLDRVREDRVREEAGSMTGYGASLKTEPGATAIPLFYLPDGRYLPVLRDEDETFRRHGFLRPPLTPRGYSVSFPTDTGAARLLRLRALFGVSARSDIVNYLALNGVGHPREIARELYYAQKSVHDVLVDLQCAGVALSARTGRERTYRLTPEGLHLVEDGPPVENWVNWPMLLAAAEKVWLLIDRLIGSAETPDGHSSATRAVIEPIASRFMSARWASALPVHDHGDPLMSLRAFRTFFDTVAQ